MFQAYRLPDTTGTFDYYNDMSVASLSAMPRNASENAEAGTGSHTKRLTSQPNTPVVSKRTGTKGRI